MRRMQIWKETRDLERKSKDRKTPEAQEKESRASTEKNKFVLCHKNLLLFYCIIGVVSFVLFTF
jgi:hypothetical protein